jgi:hypothetical protein
MWIETLGTDRTEYSKFVFHDSVAPIHQLFITTPDRINVGSVNVLYGRGKSGPCLNVGYTFKPNGLLNSVPDRKQLQSLQGLIRCAEFDFEELGIQVPSLRQSVMRAYSHLRMDNNTDPGMNY